MKPFLKYRWPYFYSNSNFHKKTLLFYSFSVVILGDFMNISKNCWYSLENNRKTCNNVWCNGNQNKRSCDTVLCLLWFSLHQTLLILSSSKFDRSVFLMLKPIPYFVGIYMTCFISRNYWSSLDHDLMASIWEKAISILTGNLNSGHM